MHATAESKISGIRLICGLTLFLVVLSGIGLGRVCAGERPDLNGALLRKPNDKNIFWIDRGQRRKIINLKTLLRLFNTNNIKEYAAVYLIKEGTPVTGISSLQRCEDGTIYFVSNNVKRVVAAPEAFHSYNFNLSGVKNASCVFLGNLPDGKPFN